MHDLLSVLGLSVLQAAISATLILSLGVLAAFGLAAQHGARKKKVLELLLLAPSLMPTLLILVASLDLSSIFGQMPIGIWGVIIVHTFVNTGLAAVTVSRLIETRLSPIVEIATIEGAAKFQLIKLSIIELSDHLRNIFGFIFILCFASFSIPLVIGAQSGRTFETLIYETLLNHSHYQLALFYSAIQVALIGAFSLINRQNFTAENFDRSHPRFLDRISLAPCLWSLVAFTVMLFASLFAGTARGFEDFSVNENLHNRLAIGAMGTLAESLAVGGIIMLGSSLIAFFSPNPRLNRTLLAFSVPSAAALGFVLVTVFDLTDWHDFSLVLLISLGFAAIMFSTIHRMKLSDSLHEIRESIECAQVFGASRWLRFTKIIWPQVKDDIGYLAGLAALWASCDFAFASMLAGRDLTLGVTAHGLLAGYRSEVATFVALMAFVIGSLVHFLFRFGVRLDFSNSDSLISSAKGGLSFDN